MDTRKTKQRRTAGPALVVPPAPEHDLEAAEEALRPVAALWVATVRQRITALQLDLGGINGLTRAGSVLGRVLDPCVVSEIHGALYDADCAAAKLNVLCAGTPVPDLEAARHRATAEHPLAKLAARELAGPTA